MEIITYSFKGFPWKSDLEQEFGEVVYLHKIKAGIEQLKSQILHEKPEVIIGIAKAPRKQSYIETKAKNQFGIRNPRKVLPNGDNVYQLSTPSKVLEPFRLRYQATTTFCNYTAYHLAAFVSQYDLQTAIMFAHVARAEDLLVLREMIKVDRNHHQDTAQLALLLV